jgi:hypothetical protein
LFLIMNFNFTVFLHMHVMRVTLALLFLIFSGSFQGLYFALIDVSQPLFEFCTLLSNLLVYFLLIVLIENLFDVFIELHWNQIGTHFLDATNTNGNWFLFVRMLDLPDSVVYDSVDVY